MAVKQASTMDTDATEAVADASQSWVDDKDAPSCMRCRAQFKTFGPRRHHCRRCGYVVCAACSKAREIVPSVHTTCPKRVCTECATQRAAQARPHLSHSWTAPAVLDGAASAAPRASSAKPLRADELNGPVPSEAEPRREFGTLQVVVKEAKGLIASDRNFLGQRTSSDPFCVLRLNDGQAVKTQTVSSCLEPVWNAKFQFQLCRCDHVLDIEVYDEDGLSANDLIGTASLPLGALHPVVGDVISGWVPLNPVDGEEGPVGAVLVELQLLQQHFKGLRHCASFVKPVPQPAAAPPAFDVDAVYGPLMKINELLWVQGIQPRLKAFLDLIFWSRPWRSVLALMLWNLAARFPEHWPAALPLFLALNIFWKRMHCTERNGPHVCGHGAVHHQHVHDGADDDESSVGGFVRRLCFILPASIKDDCREFQPLLRMGADSLQLLHDVLSGRHALSLYVVAGLLTCAALCEVLPFSLVLSLLGSGALLALSPILVAVGGLFSYAAWAMSRGASPDAFGLQPKCAEEWLSTDYSKPKASPDAFGLQLKCRRLRFRRG